MFLTKNGRRSVKLYCLSFRSQDFKWEQKMIRRNGKQNRELVYGVNAVEAALETAPEKIVSAFIIKGREDDKRISRIVSLMNNYGIKVQTAMRHTLDEITDNGVHQGVVIEMIATPPKNEGDLEELLDTLENPFFLVLDSVTDPRNLGAAMRSAWAAGAHGVIVPKDKSASFSPAARKAASGAADVLPLFAVTNLARTLEMLKDRFVRVIGMDGAATDNIYATDLTGPLAIVMGSEESGMRRLTREKCDDITKIPMAAGVESLNVSVAAGIALFEALRQRNRY